MLEKGMFFMPWQLKHQNVAGKLHNRFYNIWDCVVTQIKSVVKKCFHLQFFYTNRNFSSWSHLVQNVTKYSQNPFLRCSLTLDDRGSCNSIEVNRPKKPAYQANQGLQKRFSWSHLVINMKICGTAMILWWINEFEWYIMMQHKWSQLTKIAPL